MKRDFEVAIKLVEEEREEFLSDVGDAFNDTLSFLESSKKFFEQNGKLNGDCLAPEDALNFLCNRLSEIASDFRHVFEMDYTSREKGRKNDGV